MAVLAFAAAGRGLPVCMKLPVPLQRPYADDPRTLTEWSIASTTDLGQDAVLAVLAALNAKYANVVDPLITQELTDALLLRELAENVLASEGLESFLTVTTPEGGTPTIMTVSRSSRFRSGMGKTSPPYDGNIYGFLGEVEDGQMLPRMKLLEALLVRQALVVSEVVAASKEEVDVWYSEGPGNPQVPVQDDELVTEYASGLGVNVKVLLLQYVPMAWAPYFMAAQSLEAARQTLRRLTEGNLTKKHQEHSTSRLEILMQAARMRSGPVRANCYCSKLRMTWVTHCAVLDWTIARWATRRLAPFLMVPVVGAGGGMGCLLLLQWEMGGLEAPHMRGARQRLLAP